VKPPEGIKVLRILYPEPAFEKLSFSETEMSLFQGRPVFGAIIEVGRDVEPGTYPVKATLSYQGCDNLTCVEPASVTLEIPLKVGAITESTQAQHPAIFSKPPFVDSEGEFVGAEEPGAPGGGFAGKNLFLTFVLVFVGGLALTLTPCIYPIIPVTVSFFGGQASGKTSQTFVLALIYVLGMAITYSILGTIAAMTGSLFGSALQNPWIIAIIAIVLLAFASSMFGLWEIRLPMFLQTRTGRAKQGHIGALFMGLTVGIVAAPCIGPFVLGLLTYVGRTGNPVLGFFLFFTLAWGMGIPFLVLGTISGSISRLPRSGDWLIWVKKIFGFILIVMAFYFARHILGERIAYAGYGLTALAGGLYLGWLDRGAKGGPTFAAVKRITGLVGIVLAAVALLWPGGPIRQEAEEPGIEWIEYSDDLVAQARQEGKPVVIDFTAEWCVPCHELEEQSFSDPAVIELSKKVAPLQVDMTKLDEWEQEVKKGFKVLGVPTIIFLDGSGTELEDLRVTGFVGPEEITKRLERIIGKE
jgi:thiol:disulfide interchange protein DsbD